MTRKSAGAAVGMLVVAAGLPLAVSAHAQAGAPPANSPPAAAGAPQGPPPQPVFDNPNKGPRDFEGVWMPGRVIQSLTPIDPKAAPPPMQRPRPGAPPPDMGPLSGPSVGGPAAIAAEGSTLQCTPVWRLVGASGGMLNFWVMGPKMILLVSEEDGDTARKIYMNATHPAGLVPQPNGHSIGHWEGNVLVVDTIGFGTADGKPVDRHTVERIEKQGNKMIDHAIVQQEGKTIYVDLSANWRPDLQFSENVCEEGYRRYEIKDGDVANLNTLPEK